MAADLTMTTSTLDAAELDTTSHRTSTILIPTTDAEPRSIDGTGNNLANFEWGSANEQLIRVAESDYADGVSAPAGEDRPSAREISTAIVSQDDEIPNERQLTAFIYAWGQFIDHDMDLTHTQATDGEAFNIEVPTDDVYFDSDGSGGDLINLTRSEYDVSTGTGVDNPRQQVNSITAWIDGSMVYGSDQATADSLRSFVGGNLLTSDGGWQSPMRRLPTLKSPILESRWSRLRRRAGLDAAWPITLYSGGDCRRVLAIPDFITAPRSLGTKEK